ncbi:MAG: hypothetical protein Q8M16_23835 [Pirellulaceae bacterium]|nr:hypothetical protein [Pirellulaceae bacterium]
MASFQLAKRVEEPVEIRLVAMVYVSPDEYQQINKQNEANTKKRLAFEDNNLSHLFNRVTSSDKIERPYPPEAYAPQTKEEKEIITEYAFLWLNTRSKILPSHRFKTISFKLEGLEDGPRLMASIAEQQTEKQYRDILKMLETVAAPYEKR